MRLDRREFIQTWDYSSRPATSAGFFCCACLLSRTVQSGNISLFPGGLHELRSRCHEPRQDLFPGCVFLKSFQPARLEGSPLHVASEWAKTIRLPRAQGPWSFLNRTFRAAAFSHNPSRSRSKLPDLSSIIRSPVPFEAAHG